MEGESTQLAPVPEVLVAGPQIHAPQDRGTPISFVWGNRTPTGGLVPLILQDQGMIPFTFLPLPPVPGAELSHSNLEFYSPEIEPELSISGGSFVGLQSLGPSAHSTTTTGSTSRIRPLSLFDAPLDPTNDRDAPGRTRPTAGPLPGVQAGSVPAEQPDRQVLTPGAHLRVLRAPPLQTSELPQCE